MSWSAIRNVLVLSCGAFVLAGVGVGQSYPQAALSSHNQTSKQAFADAGKPSVSDQAVLGDGSNDVNVVGRGRGTNSLVAEDSKKPLAATDKRASQADRTRVPPQEPEASSEFQRFVQLATGRLLPIYGADLFASKGFEAVQATQVPDGYVVGPGDELVIQMYGAIDFMDRITVDREGQITIPRVGPVKVAGVRFAQLEASLTRAVGEVYRNFKLSVSMGRLRSVEVYLLGQARSPGRKVVGSLSTVINALFETGGPSNQGSLRGIELRRAGKVVTRIDLYDFIARGDNQADRALEPGDIIYIPPVGPQVAISGSVNESAIFELPANGGDLKGMLALTGGVTTLAAPQMAQLERVDPNQKPARSVQNIALDERGLATTLRAGDVVTIFQISPQFGNAVTLQSHGASPIRYTYRDGLRVSDLVSSNNALVPVSYWLRLNAGAGAVGLDQPEVNLAYATVQRLDPVRLRTETIPFHLSKALLGDLKENLQLKPGDIVRIYSPTEATQDALDSVVLQAGFIEGSGSLRAVWREGARITDVIPDVRWLQDQVTRKARSAGVKVTVQDLTKETEGALSSRDVLQQQKQSIAVASDEPKLTDSQRLSAASVQEVNLEYADVRRLDPITLEVKLLTFNLAKALAGDPAHNLSLQRGDRIGLYSKLEVPVPVERTTRLVKVLGEVGVPGTYQVNPGETLPDILKRVGGVTKQAYVYGTHFSRQSVRLEQQKNLAQLVNRIEADWANQNSALYQNSTDSDTPQRQQALMAAQRQALERLRTTPVSGRIALDLDESTPQPTLPALDLEDGDVIFVPNQSDFVSVLGAVDIASAMMYRPGQRVRDYLDRAGLRSFADLDNVILLKADGTAKTSRTVAERTSLFGWSSNNVLDQVLRPGDAILVPEKADKQTGYTVFMKLAKDWTQLIYQLGLGAAAFKALN